MLKINLLRAIKIQLFKRLIRCKKNVVCRGKICIENWPIIDVVDGCTLELGDCVTLDADNWRYGVNLYAPTKLLVRHRGGRITIGDFTRIHGSCLAAMKSIQIGKHCRISGNCQIFDCNGHSIYNTDSERKPTLKFKPIEIGDHVWIGMNSIILPGTIIGRGSVVAAGSVVRGEFLPCSLIGGNPAVFIKSLDQNPNSK